jgi:hypothetical protein
VESLVSNSAKNETRGAGWAVPNWRKPQNQPKSTFLASQAKKLDLGLFESKPLFWAFGPTRKNPQKPQKGLKTSKTPKNPLFPTFYLFSF